MGILKKSGKLVPASSASSSLILVNCISALRGCGLFYWKQRWADSAWRFDICYTNKKTALTTSWLHSFFIFITSGHSSEGEPVQDLDLSLAPTPFLGGTPSMTEQVLCLQNRSAPSPVHPAMGTPGAWQLLAVFSKAEFRTWSWQPETAFERDWQDIDICSWF